MSATGYTTIYNEVLRDSTLSLATKGLLALINKIINLPGISQNHRLIN